MSIGKFSCPSFSLADILSMQMKDITNPQEGPTNQLADKPFRGALRDTRASYFSVFRSAFPLIIFLHLLEFAASQYFSFAIDYIQSRGREDYFMIALTALLELAFGFVWAAAWIVAISTSANAKLSHSPYEGFGPHFGKHLNQLLIEQVRTLAAVIIRVPLLVIPALIQFVRLGFVPFVVIFDSAYQQGRIDALQKSRALSRGYLTRLSVALFVWIALPPWVENLVLRSQSPWIWVNPLPVTTAMLLTLFINVFATLFLFSIYRRVSMMADPAPELGSGNSDNE